MSPFRLIGEDIMFGDYYVATISPRLPDTVREQIKQRLDPAFRPNAGGTQRRKK